MICIEYTTRLLSWTWQGETSESHRVILLENVAAWLKEQLRQLFSILKSGWNPPFCERNVHETWWRNDEVCVWLHPSLFGHGLGSDDGETCYVTLWDVSFVSFPTKPGKMRKMCKMMHVLNVLRVELWKKLDAMRHPIQAGSLSVVFPCFSQMLRTCSSLFWKIPPGLSLRWALRCLYSWWSVDVVPTCLHVHGVHGVHGAGCATWASWEPSDSSDFSGCCGWRKSRRRWWSWWCFPPCFRVVLGAAHWAHIVDLVRHGLRC